MSKVLSRIELRSFLDEKYQLFNRPDFISTDPISIPHRYSKKADIEIAGFLAATIAWGQRVTILKNAVRMMEMMDDSPYSFVTEASDKELDKVALFVHRTFNGTDLNYFIRALRNIYLVHGGLEKVFTTKGAGADDECRHAIMNFRKIFFELDHPARTAKHVSNPDMNSSAKRICMFLRWMVRQDSQGVDFGIWKSTSSLRPAMLMCPLDIHSGNTARKLGLLSRTQNDWKAVTELTDSLRKLDRNDPVKYDFALFGLGVFEKF
jgi:uncharacterized protein (TIGR02757 family)